MSRSSDLFPIRPSVAAALLLLVGLLPARAVIYYTTPQTITAGVGTINLDILRVPEAGEDAAFLDPELDTFDWFAPGVSVSSGQPIRLPPAMVISGDVARVQLDASLLKTAGVANILYNRKRAGETTREIVSVTIVPPPTIEGTLTAIQVNVRMATQTLEAVNGSFPYRWSISAGSLPPGVALVGRAQSGDFVGTPTAAGSYTFTVRVTDGFNVSAEKQFTLVVSPPAVPPLRISTATIPSGRVGVPYQATIEAAGGAAPYQWSSTGSLPPGLTLIATGVLSGTPTTAGSYSVAVRVADAASSDQKTFALTIEPAPVFTSVQGASYESGVAAPDSVVAGYGENLAPALATAPAGELPTTLSGVSVAVTDSSGRESDARLFFVSPRQINYLVPATVRPGAIAVTVRSGNRTVAMGGLTIQAVAPGIFTATADGKGVAAASVLRVAADQTASPAFVCEAAGNCRPDPIDLGPATDSVYVLLFGTGVRGRGSLSGVTATVGGEAVPVTFAGAQGQFPGLDQINVGPLPRSLAGRGTVTVQVLVDGKAANPVTIAVR